MQASSALEIINALIDGAHPFSGESLSQESVLEDPRYCERCLQQSGP